MNVDPPSSAEILSTGDSQDRLHQMASGLRDERFGRHVFVRGVVEPSNFCRENCSYCGMRRDNRSLERYRTGVEELASTLIHHRPGLMTDINIQTGEDPRAVEEVVLPLLRILRKETSLGLSVCLGTLSPDVYRELRNAGASIYIMKFELADARQYEEHSAPGTLEERIDHIRHLASEGWQVSSGFIAGLPGQTPEHLLQNLELARSLPISGCSVSPFVPGDQTPLAHAPVSNLDLTLNAMAAMRIMRPDWVIPAVSALNIVNPVLGYRRGLRAGANLCTINLTPEGNRENYLLYKKERFIMTSDRIEEAIGKEGLVASKTSLALHFERSQAVAQPG